MGPVLHGSQTFPGWLPQVNINITHLLPKPYFSFPLLQTLVSSSSHNDDDDDDDDDVFVFTALFSLFHPSNSIQLATSASACKQLVFYQPQPTLVADKFLSFFEYNLVAAPGQIVVADINH